MLDVHQAVPTSRVKRPAEIKVHINYSDFGDRVNRDVLLGPILRHVYLQFCLFVIGAWHTVADCRTAVVTALEESTAQREYWKAGKLLHSCDFWLPRLII